MDAPLVERALAEGVKRTPGWFIEGRKAELEMVNDTGSDDLRATLEQKDDSTYVLRQGNGSTIKVPNNNKWQKLPNTLVFKRK